MSIPADDSVARFIRFCPQVFNGCIEVPRFGERCPIGFEFCRCQGAVFRAKVLKHGTGRDIAKPEDWILKGF